MSDKVTYCSACGQLKRQVSPPIIPLPIQLFTARVLAEGDAVAQLVAVFKVEHIINLQLELAMDYKSIFSWN